MDNLHSSTCVSECPIFDCLKSLSAYTSNPSYFLVAPSTHEDSGAAEIAHRNKQTIDAKFAKLLTNICSKLSEREINMRKLRLFLRTFSPGEWIPETTDIHEIFDALSCNKLWDSWNYYLLEQIAEEFGAGDQEIASWIEAYLQDLKSYKVSTKLIDHIATVDSVPVVEDTNDKPARYDKQYYQKLSFKLKTKFTDQTMDYIDHLWSKVAELYGLPPCVVILDSIRKGCVSIVWRVPSHVAPKILEAPPPSDEFYHKHEITRVEYGGESIYQEGEVHIMFCVTFYQRSCVKFNYSGDLRPTFFFYRPNKSL